MKKACYFIGAPVGTGAIADYFGALGSELAARGHIVKFFTHSSPFDEKNGDQNPATLHWPSPRPTRLADALFLARLIRRHRPDCLLANFAAVNWMCLTGWLCGVTHRLAFYHTLNAQMQVDVSSNNSLAGISLFRKKMVYRTATCIAGISQAALSDAQNTFHVPAAKCQLWRYSMPDPVGHIALKSAARRENLIVCVARLSPSKGQDVLISALALLQGPAASTKVEFLGQGPALENLRRLAEKAGVTNRCRFVGLVSHEQVLTRMSQAKVTVVPSRREAFGLVNIESMSVGTSVIASRVDGIQEIVRDGVDGYLVPPDDAQALAEKLARVLQEPALRERLGLAARRHFLEDYENSLVVKRQADSLEAMVQPAGEPAIYGS